MTRPRRLLGLLAAVTLTVTVVPLTALGDVTIGTPEFVERTPAGTLVLATGDETLTVTYLDEAENLVREARQVLRKNDKCQVDAPTFDGLLGIEVLGGSGFGVGLVSNGLGSREADNCSTGNGRVELGQEGLQLTLELPEGVVVDRAVLDIEAKFGADLRVEGTLFGAATLDATADLAAGSDNGADAGALDNTDVTIGTTDPGDDFDVVTLAVASDDGRGEIALEGGGDHDVPAGHRTIFHLVHRTDYEYALGCGETIDSSDDDSFGDADSGADVYEVTRYDADLDASGGACAPIGADLSSDGDGVLFRKTTTDAEGHEQDPTIRLTLKWKVELYESDGTTPRPTAAVEAELARQIDLLDGDGLTDVQYCLRNNDTPKTDDAEAVLASADRPEGVPWCLLDETIEVKDGFLLQTHVYDGSGDPRWL